MIRLPHLPSRSALLGTGLAAVSAAGLLAAAPSSVAAAPTHTIHVQGVTLRVPAGWHLAHAAHLPGCVVDQHLRAVSPQQDAYGVNGCEFQVFAGRHLPSQATPNRLYFPGDPAQCLRGSHAVDMSTVAASHAHVGRASAQYRRFTSPCLRTPLEQWFSGHQPGVLIERTHASSATEAVVRRAVASAHVPSGHGTTRGFTGTPRGAGTTRVLLAPTRITYRGDHRPSATTTHGRTELFAVPTSATIDYVDAGGGAHRLTRAQFLRDVRRGFPYAHGLQPQIAVQSGYRANAVSTIHVELASS